MAFLYSNSFMTSLSSSSYSANFSYLVSFDKASTAKLETASMFFWTSPPPPDPWTLYTASSSSISTSPFLMLAISKSGGVSYKGLWQLSLKNPICLTHSFLLFSMVSPMMVPREHRATLVPVYWSTTLKQAGSPPKGARATSGKLTENKIASKSAVWKTEKVMLLRTALTGSLMGLSKFPMSSLTISRSPSLIRQVSNLWGLYETLFIWTLNGSFSYSSSPPSASEGAQGSSLQGLVIMASPAQGGASGADPKIHSLCKV